MSWKHLSNADLKLVLSQDEIDKVSTLSLDPSLSAVVDDTIDMVSDTWRGALSGKGVKLDVREHYTPSAYSYFILVHARQVIWSRFPNSPLYALDEVRKEEYKKALEMLVSCSIGADKPEWQYDPENPINGGPKAGTITLPKLKFDEDLWWYQNELSIKLI